MIIFGLQVKLLMRVHHKNLTTLVGYCYEGTNMGLVYENVRNTKGFVLYFLNERIYISALYRRRKCAVQVKCSTSTSVPYK